MCIVFHALEVNPPAKELLIMPRPKKPNPELRPVSNTNDLNDEQKGKLFSQHVDKLVVLVRKVDEAVSARRLQRKVMRQDGFSAGEIDHALWLLKQEADEPTDDIEMRVRVAKWLGKPIGFQPDMFAAAAQ
jgi:hypothetical protein